MQEGVEGDVEVPQISHARGHANTFSEDLRSGDYGLKGSTTAVLHGFKPDPCKLTRKNNLRAYVDGNHNGQKSYQCMLCEYSAKRTAHLKTHIDAVHKSLKSYQCELCDFCAMSSGKLTKHINVVHKEL